MNKIVGMDKEKQITQPEPQNERNKKKRKFTLRKRLNTLMGLGAVNTALLIGALLWGKGNENKKVDQNTGAEKIPDTIEQVEKISAADTIVQKEIDALQDVIETNNATTVKIETEGVSILTTERRGNAYCVKTYSEDDTIETIKDGTDEWVFRYDRDGNFLSRSYSNGDSKYMQTVESHGRMYTYGPIMSEAQAKDLAKMGIFDSKAFPEISEKADAAFNKTRAQQKKAEEFDRMRDKMLEEECGI